MIFFIILGIIIIVVSLGVIASFDSIRAPRDIQRAVERSKGSRDHSSQIQISHPWRAVQSDDAEALSAWDHIVTAIEDGHITTTQVDGWIQNIESGGDGGGWNEFALDVNDEDPEYIEVYYIGLEPRTVMCTTRALLVLYKQVALTSPQQAE